MIFDESVRVVKLKKATYLKRPFYAKNVAINIKYKIFGHFKIQTKLIEPSMPLILIVCTSHLFNLLRSIEIACINYRWCRLHR